MSLKGAQMTSGIVLDILTRLSGVIDTDNGVKRHTLKSSINVILKTLDANRETTVPFSVTR